jgi:hypothetical protein
MGNEIIFRRDYCCKTVLFHKSNLVCFAFEFEYIGYKQSSILLFNK